MPFIRSGGQVKKPEQLGLGLTGGANCRVETAPVYTPPAIGSFKMSGRIALDIETFDPDIKTRMGTFDPRSYILGVALAHAEQDSAYFAVRSGLPSDNLVNEQQFRSWLKAEAANFEGEIVGANLQYDLAMLRSKWGIVFPKAKLLDVQIAEPLLDENQYVYNLDAILNRNGMPGKKSTVLDRFGGIERIAEAPAGAVAEYAIGDVDKPLELIERQLKRLEDEELMDVFRTESDLLPILVDMHMRGVRVDLGKAEEAHDRLGREIEDMKRTIGVDDIWSADAVAKLFDWTPTTPKTGKPSITKDWLKLMAKDGDKNAQALISIREFDKTRSTFIKSYILNKNVDGRIHCAFHQLRSQEGGTVSGRFSSSGPNLQNIPARHPVIGPLMRGLFIPEDGCRWGCADWSQIEYRFLVHFAVQIPDIHKSAFDAQKAYNSNPKTDFHEIASELTGVERKDAKAINFGVVYGMGKDEMAKNLAKPLDEAEEVLRSSHEAFPFLRQTYKYVMDRADRRGFIRTLSGRKRRFPDFKAKNWKTGDERVGTEGEVTAWADEQKGRIAIQRDGTHAALNSLLQGSSADLMKEAMVKMKADGVMDVIKCHLTVHDELDSSFEDTKEGREAFEHSVRIMENVRSLNVPATASFNTGGNWQEAK